MLDTSARLLRLLTVLQTRRFWAGTDLADALEVTPRTLRRDVDRLRDLGYNIDSTGGPGGGYQLSSGRKTPPLLLSDDEAVAVTVALRSAVDAFAGLSETALRVLVKLEQLLPARLRHRIGALHAMTVSVSGAQTELDLDTLTAIAGACRDTELLRFLYRNREGRLQTRRVEPLRLAHTPSRRWYLVAYDLEREDWRTFRVDRVAQILETGPRFSPRPPPGDLATYVSDSITRAPHRFQARAILCGSAELLASRVPPWCGVLEARDERSCVLHTGAGSVEALACHLILCGAEIEDLEPRELRPQVRAVAERLVRAAGA